MKKATVKVETFNGKMSEKIWYGDKCGCLMVVTPQIAQSWLPLIEPEKQRAIRGNHVKYLSDAIKANRAQIASIRFARNSNGVIYLLDGQHFTHAIVKSDIPALCAVEMREADGDGYIANAFEDAGSSLARGIEGKTKQRMGVIGVKWSKKVGAAILSFAKSELEGNTLTYTQRSSVGRKVGPGTFAHDVIALAGLGLYIEEGNFISKIINDQDTYRALLERAVVIRAMVITHRLDRDMAKAFWQVVGSGYPRDIHDPRWVLSRWLQRVMILKNKPLINNLQTQPFNLFVLAKCLKAWQLYGKYKSLKQASFPIDYEVTYTMVDGKEERESIPRVPRKVSKAYEDKKIPRENFDILYMQSNPELGAVDGEAFDTLLHDPLSLTFDATPGRGSD